jgi:Protein of unknown function (DUF1579)
MPPTPHPETERLEALIGTWRTEGEVLGDDGSSPVATVEGTDAYEWLGRHFVVHRIDVQMGDDHIRGLELIGPYEPDIRAFPTRACDNQGGVQTSVATVDDDGVWTFGAAAARATLRLDEDGRRMRAVWDRMQDGGETWRPWLRLRFTRQGG